MNSSLPCTKRKCMHVEDVCCSLQMAEVRVPNLDCQGCASTLNKAHLKLKGVDKVEIEMEMQKITVTGHGIEEKEVLKATKRAGKAAEPWSFPGYSDYTSFYKYPTYIVNHYYDNYKYVNSNGVHTFFHTPVNHYYDNYKYLNSNGVHTFFHTPAVYSVAVASDEAVASIFSDDNLHVCSIM